MCLLALSATELDFGSDPGLMGWVGSGQVRSGLLLWFKPKKNLVFVFRAMTSSCASWGLGFKV